MTTPPDASMLTWFMRPMDLFRTLHSDGRKFLTREEAVSRLSRLLEDCPEEIIIEVGGPERFRHRRNIIVHRYGYPNVAVLQ